MRIRDVDMSARLVFWCRRTPGCVKLTSMQDVFEMVGFRCGES